MIKDVPYFPFYAANMMSSRSFRLMSLKERGLLITIMMECWINGGVPSDITDMAKILGLTVDDVKFAFTNRQLTFFHKEEGQFISKELEGYRQNYLDMREKQRLGGLKGAKNKKDKNARLPKGQPQGEPEGSLSQISSNSFNSNQLLKKEVMDKEVKAWIRDYESAPEAISYSKVSRG
jgi:uncharacterized protein YdaU (DUF1376 family)